MPDSATPRPVAGPVEVLVRQIDPDVPLPRYAHPGDAGADLVTAEDVELPPGGRALVRTGVAIALPEGFVGLVHPRSGLADRMGVTVLNAPGTVDAGYRGEIRVNLVNHDPVRTARLARGDRIAQLVVQQVERARFHLVTGLPDSSRGAGGHGSTGGFGHHSPGGTVSATSELATPSASVRSELASPAVASEPGSAASGTSSGVNEEVQ